MNTQTTNSQPAVRREGNGCHEAMFAEHIIEPQTEQVTTFVEAGDTNTTIANTPQRGPQLKAASELLPETTSGILERPYRITTFKWTQEQTVNTTLFDGELFSRWLANPNFSRILSLYEYVRADFTILVQVNAQAFNAGMLCGAIYPRFANQVVPNCTRNIRGLSGMKSMRLDIADETSAAIAANWFSPTSHMRTLPSGTSYSEWLGFRLAVYAPLTGAGDVDITIWLTARNVELAMPRGISRTDPPEIGDGGFPGEDETGEVQSAGTEQAEATLVQQGSNAIRTVQQAASTAATWWTTISSIFVALGLSKPRMSEPTMRMQPNVMADMGAGDGVSAPKMLAMFTDNAIDNAPIKTLDEDDPHVIANIIKRPCYLNTVRWLAQDQPERVIATIRNGLVFEPDIPGVSPGTYARSWLSYFNQIFRFWSGSITYRIHIVKTKFHSGRLEVSFVPFETLSTEDRDHTNAFRAILDIRQASVFDVTIPYVFPEEMIQGNNATGTLFIKVVNDLVVGGGAAPYVDIVIEKYSRDMVFAVPMNIPQTQPGITLLGHSEEGQVQFCDEQVVAIDLFPKQPISPIKVCSYTVGEAVLDLRQLMKRYLWMYTAEANETLNKIRAFNGPSQHNGTANVNYELRDYMGAFAQLFGFMTGGVRWLFLAQGEMAFAQQFDVSGSAGPVRHSTSMAPLAGGAVVYKTPIEPTVEIQAPYYARTPFVQSAGFPAGVNPWRGTEWICTQIEVGKMQAHEAYRSVAEDFTFGLLLGPPPTQT